MFFVCSAKAASFFSTGCEVSILISRRSVSSEMSTVRISVCAISASISFVSFMTASPFLPACRFCSQQIHCSDFVLQLSAVPYSFYFSFRLSYANPDCPFFLQFSMPWPTSAQNLCPVISDP